MKVLLSWLREFAPDLPDDAERVGTALGALGTPVEEMLRIGHGLDGIVVARVLDLRPHPDADRIQLVDVDLGDGNALQICCGAFNMQVGDLVPLATIGTTMPNGMEIARRKLRGELSNGMLCSPPELGLSGDAGGILVLGETHAPGTPLREALGIESDVLYDLEVNPNRPDAMSVAGVARDVAAHFRVPFAIPNPDVGGVAVGDPVESLARVENLAPDLCGRFTARVLQGVTVGPSSTRIASRLTLLGMRPINNVVDVSNYVMLELGQPSHPYDLARVGGGGLRVRRAKDGETLITLDDVERRFTTDDLLICDANDEADGVAGIMGGASSEISASTKAVLVEMAWFHPMTIATSSRRLGVRSEASARFEKGTDPEIIEQAQDRFVELLGGAAGRMAKGIVDVVGDLPQPATVRVRTHRVNGILGTDLEPGPVRALLEPIGFAATRIGDDLEVTIPSWRPDSSTEIDVIEEIGRHYGYERIGAVVPPAVHFGGLSARQADRRAARDVLVGLGFSEALPMPFLAPDDLQRAELPHAAITITNPLIADESVLRTSLLPGLLKTVAYNESHRAAGVALFELGHVFRIPATPHPLPDELDHLAVALAGVEAPVAAEVWEALATAFAVDAHALEGATAPGLHPTRTAAISVAGEEIGHLGEVHPRVLTAFGVTERVAWLELDLGRLLDLPHGARPYRPVSRYPSSDVDLAFETDDAVPAAAVESALREGTGELLAALELFDEYRGAGVAAGTRSLGYRLRLQAADRTLTDAEIGDVRERAIQAVTRATGATLRS
ncbi:MAG TPA: phenylalanine--tRNA ligase subunit beta [Acidimicrobiales bacterium]|jgi:phenylalanyl-tRNA synthetase beta chain|nr:phenylalanine--tRNA ligase subunit beta [Acidimicrobiales bacterium]